MKARPPAESVATALVPVDWRTLEQRDLLPLLVHEHGHVVPWDFWWQVRDEKHPGWEPHELRGDHL